MQRLTTVKLRKLAESLLSLESSLVKPGGLFCLDILRMEAWLPCDDSVMILVVTGSGLGGARHRQTSMLHVLYIYLHLGDF